MSQRSRVDFDRGSVVSLRFGVYEGKARCVQWSVDME